MRDGSFSTGNRRESFDETAGVVDVASTFADRECPVWTGHVPTVAEDEIVDNKNLSPSSSTSEGSSRLLFRRSSSMLVWLDALSQSWGDRHFFFTMVH